MTIQPSDDVGHKGSSFCAWMHDTIQLDLICYLYEAFAVHNKMFSGVKKGGPYSFP